MLGEVVLEIGFSAYSFEGDVQGGSDVGLIGDQLLEVSGFAYAWFSGVAVEIVGGDVEIGVMVICDGAELVVGFGGDEVADEVPVF